MIIEMMLDVLYNICDILFVFNIPDLPSEVQGYINTFFDYLVAGVGILANYVPLSYLLTLFGVILALDLAIMYYHFIMWVLRKIPLAGIS